MWHWLLYYLIVCQLESAATSLCGQARGCPLRGIHATPDLAAHMRRFTDNGWARTEAESMSTVYRTCLDPAEKRR